MLVDMEKRWGDEWRPGMRVRMPMIEADEFVMRDGTITDRSWGRDRGKPVWYFDVVFDGDTETHVFEPGQIAVGIENARKAADDMGQPPR